MRYIRGRIWKGHGYSECEFAMRGIKQGQNSKSSNLNNIISINILILYLSTLIILKRKNVIEKQHIYGEVA